MRLVVVAAVALFLGILLGGYGPTAELQTLRDQQSEANLLSSTPGPCDSSVGSDLASLLGSGVGRPDAPIVPKERPPDDAPAPGAVEAAAEIDAASAAAEQRFKDDLEAAANDEDELELARTALELRRTQARASLLERTDAEDEQMEQFDTAVDSMNDVLLDLTEEMTEMVEGDRRPGRREAMEFAADALDALLSAEDNMRSVFENDQLQEVEDAALDPFSYIDPAIIDTLEGLDFDKSPGEGG